MKLKNKYIWLIGASEGIGAALAAKLSQAGAHVAISARNETKLGEVINALAPGNHHLLAIDVTREESIMAAWENLQAKWPSIDMVIYNAGVYEPMDALHYDVAHALKMVDVNLLGIFRVLKPVLPYLTRRGEGRLVLVGSVAGYRGLPAAIGYGASKAGVIHLAENLKADLVNTGVTVQVVNPGFVDTRLTKKNNFYMPAMISADQAAAAILQGVQSGRFEIHFPKRVTLLLKFLSLLPAPCYFWLVKWIKVWR